MEGGPTLELTLLIPAYNEAALIEHTLEETLAYLRGCCPASEILVMDDGSQDETPRLVQAFSNGQAGGAGQAGQPGPLLRLVRSECNHGKGQAIRRGVQECRGELIIFMDADLPYDLSAIPQMRARLLDGYDLALGSRRLAESRLDVNLPALRVLAGKLFHLLSRLVLGLEPLDTQCGFKGFRRTAALEIFRRVTISGFGFDVEALYVARKLGLRSVSVPVHMIHTRGDSRVRVIKDALKMFLDLFVIRWKDLRGKYQ